MSGGTPAHPDRRQYDRLDIVLAPIVDKHTIGEVLYALVELCYSQIRTIHDGPTGQPWRELAQILTRAENLAESHQL